MNQVTEEVRVGTLTLDGEPVEFREGETIYEIAERCRREVPTLCYDPRLEAFGACRLCVVEVEGVRNPVASCTARATAHDSGWPPYVWPCTKLRCFW